MSSHRRFAELETEQPLFIDPASEDPTSFIEYRREYAAPVAGTTIAGPRDDVDVH